MFKIREKSTLPLLSLLARSLGFDLDELIWVSHEAP